jgi:endoglucanase
VASGSAAEKWLVELTHLPTASALEDAVVDWARSWVGRRSDLRLSEDQGGNLLITQKGPRHRDPVLAVAHMDHPAFVVTDVTGGEAAFEFRGGVRAEYFDRARVEFVTGPGSRGQVTSYEPATRTGTLEVTDPPPRAGDIARWRLPSRKREGRLFAPACDDLAGCAAALAALDRARRRPDMRHFGVLLTRAEEMGLLGAIHAAKAGGIPAKARILSIETSRSSADAPIGGGPVIRVGDAATVFDHDLTNRVSGAVAASGIRHQRKLMAGGVCEATAFGAYGYQTTGLCLPLGNYHNMGNLDEVEAGRAKARPMLEEVSLADFHGLVDLLMVAATAVDADWDLPRRLDEAYSEGKHLLG